MGAKGRTVQPDGNKIQALRINKGWSIEELSGQSDLSEKTIKSLEDGNPCFLSTLRELGKALDVESKDLLIGSLPSLPALEQTYTITITIKTSRQDFDETTDLIHLVNTLIKRVALGDIEPVKTSKGSTNIDFALTAKEIIQLIKAYKDGLLDDLDIVSIASPNSFPYPMYIFIGGKNHWADRFSRLERDYNEMEKKNKEEYKTTD